MRGNYDCSYKTINCSRASDAVNTKGLNLKTSTKISWKLINADNLDELINLLHNEAKSNLINSRKSKVESQKKIASQWH
jgi:hypothetical protein